MHLPRSVFSRKQLDLFLWLLRINNVDQVPSTKSMQTMNKILQNICGIETLPFNGKLGHKYHVNSLGHDQTCNHICPKNTLFLNHPWRQTMPLPGPQAAKRTSPPSAPPLHPPQKLPIENVFNLRLYSCLRVIKSGINH